MISVDWDPRPRTLRQFAAIGGLVLVGAATSRYLRGGASPAVATLVTLAAILAVAAWVRPAALRLPYVLLTLLVFPIGKVVSHVILLALFFGVITPLGLLARVARPDPLHVRRDARAGSYWERRPRPRDPASYLRQS